MQIRCRHNAAKLKGSCDAGETAVSVPIYFLPGMLCDRRQWEPVWACLQAIVPKGFCHAEWFDFHAADDASMTSFAQEVADRARKAPGIVAGFSMGGHVAFELYRQCPEAIGGCCATHRLNWTHHIGVRIVSDFGVAGGCWPL